MCNTRGSVVVIDAGERRFSFLPERKRTTNNAVQAYFGYDYTGVSRRVDACTTHVNAFCVNLPPVAGYVAGRISQTSRGGGGGGGDSR